MIKVNVINSVKDTRIQVEQTEDLKEYFNWKKRTKVDKKGGALYNLSSFQTLSRGGFFNAFSHLCLDFEAQPNQFRAAKIKQYHFIAYQSFNNGFHIILPLDKEYSKDFWDQNQKGIKNFIKSLNFGDNIDLPQTSPNRWFFLPHTKNPTLDIKENKAQKLNLEHLLHKTSTTPQHDHIISTLIKLHNKTLHHQELLGVVNSLKKLGLNKEAIFKVYEQIKSPESKDNFDSTYNWVPTDTVYSLGWLLKFCGLEEEDEIDELTKIILNYDIRVKVGEGVYSFTKSSWLPKYVTSKDITEIFQVSSSNKHPISKIRKRLGELNRTEFLDVGALYFNNILRASPKGNYLYIVQLIKNLCDNGLGNKELEEQKFEWLMRWFYIATHIKNPHQLPALCFFGVAGSGKTLFSSLFRTIFQTPEAVFNANSTSPFNNWETSKVLLFEEMSTNKADVNKIKEWVMSERIKINKKGINEFTIPNHFLFQFNSNELLTGINIKNDSGFTRRWSFFKTGKALDWFLDDEEITRIANSIKNRECVAAFLDLVNTKYITPHQTIKPIHDDLKAVKDLITTEYEEWLIEQSKEVDAISWADVHANFFYYHPNSKHNYKTITAGLLEKNRIPYKTRVNRTYIPFKYGLFFFKNNFKKIYNKGYN